VPQPLAIAEAHERRGVPNAHLTSADHRWSDARVPETAARADGTIGRGLGWTDLFIHTPYRFRAVDALLMLVAAFASYEAVLAAYRGGVRTPPCAPCRISWT